MTVQNTYIIGTTTVEKDVFETCAREVLEQTHTVNLPAEDQLNTYIAEGQIPTEALLGAFDSNDDGILTMDDDVVQNDINWSRSFFSTYDPGLWQKIQTSLETNLSGLFISLDEGGVSRDNHSQLRIFSHLAEQGDQTLNDMLLYQLESNNATSSSSYWSAEILSNATDDHTINQVIANLDNPNREILDNCVKILRKKTNPQALKVLMQKLQSRDKEQCIIALNTLTGTTDHEAFLAITAKLKSSDAVIRRNACLALHDTPFENEANQALFSLLNDKNKPIKNLAVSALLTSSDPQYRWQAAIAGFDINDYGYGQISYLVNSELKNTTDQNAVDAVISKMTSGLDSTREKACDILAARVQDNTLMVSRQKEVTALLNALSDKDERIVRSAFYALAELRDATINERLKQLPYNLPCYGPTLYCMLRHN